MLPAPKAQTSGLASSEDERENKDRNAENLQKKPRKIERHTTKQKSRQHPEDNPQGPI